MQLSVRVTMNDAGMLHERTYTASLSLPLATNLEQVELTTRSLLAMLSDRAQQDWEELDDGDGEPNEIPA